jgi:hypothetical protein
MPAAKGTQPPNAGKGRPKGATNKVTRTLREMILGALDDAGAQAYLTEQARENPVAFMALLVHRAYLDSALQHIQKIQQLQWGPARAYAASSC